MNSGTRSFVLYIQTRDYQMRWRWVQRHGRISRRGWGSGWGWLIRRLLEYIDTVVLFPPWAEDS